MGLWLANLSNFILCFTYFKAVINTLLVKMGFKKASGFKVGGVVAVCSCTAAQLCCEHSSRAAGAGAVPALACTS